MHVAKAIGAGVFLVLVIALGLALGKYLEGQIKA